MPTQSYLNNQQLMSCRLASIANLAGTYSNGNYNTGVGATLTISGTITIDSIAPDQYDRVVLRAQTNTNENGIYLVTQNVGTTILTRSGDLQCIEQVQPGGYIPIFDGSTLSGTIRVIKNPLPIAFGINGLSIS